MCEGREEDPESGGVKGNLETLILLERKTVRLDCLMLNTRSDLYFRFGHICVQKCPSHALFLFRARPA